MNERKKKPVPTPPTFVGGRQLNSAADDLTGLPSVRTSWWQQVQTSGGWIQQRRGQIYAAAGSSRDGLIGSLHGRIWPPLEGLGRPNMAIPGQFWLES